jgi:hypothetical protein
VQWEFPLRVATHLHPRYAYYPLGEYRRAVELLRPEVATLSSPVTHDYLGLAALPAVSARVSMARNLAELGEFPEGEAFGPRPCGLPKPPSGRSV